MAKKQKSKYPRVMPVSTTEQNLLWALVALLICTFVSAVSVSIICDYVLNSFQNSNAMAGLITDAGLVFDDKNLEHNISSATAGLKLAGDFGLALAIGVAGVGVAVFIRFRRQNAL